MNNSKGFVRDVYIQLIYLPYIRKWSWEAFNESMVSEKAVMINIRRYAADTRIIAETETELQQLIDIVVQERNHKQLYLNITNSFTIVFSKSANIPACHITLHGKLLDQVNTFIYLGSLLTSDGRWEQFVRCRIVRRLTIPILISFISHN